VRSSTPSHGHHHLDAIPVHEPRLAEPAARHDLAVALDREAAAGEGELVASLGLAGKRLAVERNGEIVPRSRYADTPLAAGDRLEIVGAVGGG
jgi:sulfur carrier protein